jgi:hypothetical protein
VTFLNRAAAILLVFFVLAGNNVAHAQLWRYLNDSPEKEKAADMELKKEAFSVITKNTVVEGDTLTYDLITYAIKSFDGVTAKINLWKKPFSDHVFHIDLPDDKLIIRDFYSLLRVHHLSNDLLEIVYSPRGGSNQGYDNVLILGVNKGKFCIVAEIQSLDEFDYPDVYGLYNLHLKLQGANINNYRMIVKVRDLLKSDNKTQISHDRSSKFLLKFNKDQHIFYTANRQLNAYTYKNDYKTKKDHVKGIYPMIELGEYRYCFFKKTWYSVWKDKTTGEVSLSAYSSRPNSP